MDKQIESFGEYMKARQEAEEKGEHDFACPICGGEAWWERSDYNGHLRSKCEDCGMAIIQ